MYILKVGVNYQTTPLEIRENLRFSDEVVDGAMLSLQGYDYIAEHIILSTCNRTEIFAVVPEVNAGKASLIRFLSTWFKLSSEELSEYCEFKEGEAAIRHIFTLAVGLNSLVLGETQILGQVRDAFLRAQDLKTIGKIFNELFKRVITFAKSAHHKTAIGAQAVSVSYVAVELAKQIIGDLSNKHAAILGAGEMGELALKNLQGAGVSQLTVINRNVATAQYVAKRFGATAASINECNDILVDVDILIASTSADKPIITKELLKPVMSKRQQALILIDIAVPRDIAADVATLDNVYLYDVDDLQYVADENMEARKAAAVQIEKQLDDELISFQNWIIMLDAVPLIRALREKSFYIQERTLDSIYRKIPNLDEREMKVLQKHTKSIVNQLIEQPIKQAKWISMQDSFEEDKTVFQNIFGLDEDDKKYW